MDATYQFGKGFAVFKDYEFCMKEFNPVSECMYDTAGHKTF